MTNGIPSLWLSEVLSRGISACTMIVVARTLGAEVYGLLGYAGALAMYLMIAVQFGSDMIIVRELTKGKVDGLIAVSATALRFTAFAFATMALLVLSASSTDPDLKNLFLANIVFVGSAVFPWEAFYQAQSRFAVLSRTRIAVSVLNVAVVLTVVRDDFQAWYVPVIFGSVSLLVQIFLVPWRRLHISVLRTSKWIHDAMFLFRQSAPLCVSAFLLLWISNNGLLLLQWLRSSHEAGLYAVAMKLFDISNAFIIPVAVVLYPHLVRVFQRPDRTARGELITRGIRIATTLSVILIGLALLSAEKVILFFLGNEYQEASAVFVILIAALAVRSMTMFLANGVVAMGAQRVSLAITAAIAFVSLGLGYALIGPYGAPGVAGAFTLSFVVELVLYAGVMRKEADHAPMIRQAAVIMAVGGGSMLIGFTASALFGGEWSGTLLGVFAFLGVFLPAVVRFRIVSMDDLKNNLLGRL